MRLLPLALIAALATAGCASPGGVPRPFPAPRDAIPGAGPGGGGQPASAIVETALALRGVPYRDGGADPSGFDCSGFVAYVFGRQGRYLPRTVNQQYETGRAIHRTQIAPGDLVFFTTIAPGASHVGVAISSSRFIHAPNSTGTVRVESFRTPYWTARFVGARRLP
jgi:peptidoglycan DL-endopeptidase CwlO